MKKFCILIIAFLAINSAMAQGCLPDGITFTTQEQIDNFQIDYPGCAEIEGNVIISGDDIVNLNGLSVLTSIGGNFYIGGEDGGNPNLTSLTGLDNLTFIGGYLSVNHCNKLTNLTGLNNLTSVEGGWVEIRGNIILENLVGLENLTSAVGLDINFNWGLTSLNGLNNLTSLKFLNLYHNAALESLEGLNNVATVVLMVHINENESLVSLLGLNNLNSIGDELFIWNNYTLENINSLENLTSIEGGLSIAGNSLLTSLTGLDNIEPASISGIDIFQNSSLSSCDVQSICNYLSSPYGPVTIYNNAEGCNSPPEIASSCGNTMPCLPYGNYYFDTQQKVNSFQADYQGCSDLYGDVFIMNEDIDSLNGLSNITSISGDLVIFNTFGLTSLEGLDNLNSVGGDLYIGGYDNWPYHGETNEHLNDISSLMNLKHIGHQLTVKYNPELPCLTGLDSIIFYPYPFVEIGENEILSACSVKSICDGLEGNGYIEIYSNSTGCNSREEVEAACLVGLENIIQRNEFSIFPNPSSSSFTIQFNLENEEQVKLLVLNNFGQVVAIVANETLSAGQHELNWNAEGMPAGVYFYNIQIGNQAGTGKMVLMR
jgi:hypothetical protein